jgi:hypothetical protein
MADVKVTTVVVEVARREKSAARATHLALNVMRQNKEPIRCTHVALNVLREYVPPGGNNAVVFVVSS